MSRMIKLSSYRFTPEVVGRFICIDCGINVIECGDFCMISSEIWEDQLHLGWNDNLCIACIEKRIGRQLTLMDIGIPPSVEGYPMSDRMIDRMGGRRTCEKRKPRRKVTT